MHMYMYIYIYTFANVEYINIYRQIMLEGLVILND